MIERRSHLRHRVSTVAYVGLDDFGGGILLDVSEAGMGIQAVGHFAPQQTLRFSLELAGTPRRIEGTTQVAWTNPSGQTGFRFLEVSPESRRHLNEWLFVNALSGWTATDAPALPRLGGETAPDARAATTVATQPARVRVPVPAPRLEPRPVPPRRETARPRPALKPGVLVGPFPLTVRSIDSNVSSDSKGIYLLGELDGRVFDVLKVGRSDDLKATLAEYLGKYHQFKFATSLSERDAWDRECQTYHQYRPRDNKGHPTRRYGTDWDCTVCHGFS